MPKATSQKRLNRDHARRQQRPMVEEEVIAAQLSALVTPAITAQENYYRQLGMRDRILNLPFMVAAVLTLLWRDVASVREMTRILGREGFLWCVPTQVTQQAVSQRFLTFPAELFERVFKELLPEFRKRWLGRTKRPLPDSIQFASGKFERIWACDGSTLEAIFRKLNSLEDVPMGKLAGKMGVVIDLITRLPVAIWFRENPKASDVNFESDILNIITSKTLILLDRGFYHFRFWQQLVEKEAHFITRLKKGAALEIKQILTDSYSIRDRLVRMGSGTQKTPYITVRLVEIRSGKAWHSYLTSVIDPLVLPPYVVADLYGKRWRIEEAFNTVKRLLGLSYLWTGSINGIQLQLWGTWLFYAVLVDLGDAIADRLALPFDRISLEMTYRGLYHFYVAHQKGLATDPVLYFAAPENQDLGVVKTVRKPNVKLIIAPFPDSSTRHINFFFERSPQVHLTTASQA
jgi:Transposase DDE domain